MSDVGLFPDGFEALLAILAADCLLLLGFALLLIFGWIRRRRTKEVIRLQPIYPHLVGSLMCAVVCSGIGLVVFLRDLQHSHGPLEAWLDRWLLLWLPAILMLWPASVAIMSRRRFSPGMSSTETASNGYR